MRTTTKAGIKATYYNEAVWKQERLLIYVEKTVGSTATKVSLFYSTHSLGTYGSPFVTYDLDSNGKAVIDVTDLVRTYAVTNITEHIYIYSDLAASLSDAIDISTKVIGLIIPYDVIIPPHGVSYFQPIVMPPQKMIIPQYGGFGAIKFEIRTDTGISSGTDSSIKIIEIEGGVSSTRDVSQPSHTLEDPLVDKIKLYDNTITPTQYYTIDLQKQQCDKRYACVQWVSFSGAERRHMFEVRKVQNASADNYSLLTDDNSYNEIKGRTDSFVLYLDGLTPYDYWYYSDLITSSKVMVAVDENNADFRQVQVVTKSVTQPDGNAFDGKLEIQVNWKRYDAVAM